MKVIFFADPLGNPKDDAFVLEGWLSDLDPNLDFRFTLESPFREYFDMLIFDYGGMVYSRLFQDLSRDFIRSIEDNPNRIYYIWSALTVQVMKDDFLKMEHFPLNLFWMQNDKALLERIEEIVEEEKK